VAAHIDGLRGGCILQGPRAVVRGETFGLSTLVQGMEHHEDAHTAVSVWNNRRDSRTKLAGNFENPADRGADIGQRPKRGGRNSGLLAAV